MSRVILKNIVWKEDKYYVARCLNVEVSSFGETRKEALENLNEALELYFEDVKLPKVSQVSYPKLADLPLNYA
ncbi:MAG: type II toxin-antitoxin system HicB family antitoxin [Patescibacteria group bacterium]|nr:type II toxin-antitoxin system HicB family antitoxin [Patescibacteria group bacterium]